VAVAGAAVVAVLAQERTRDHAADIVWLDQLEGRFAHGVQALQAEVFFVGGDLHHRVARGIDDDLAGGDMLVAVLVDDVGARGVTVAQVAHQVHLLLQRVGQLLREGRHVAREVAPVEGDRHAGDFPVAALRILAGGLLARRTVGAGEAVALAEAFGPLAAGQLGRCRKAEFFQVGQRHRLALISGPAGDMAKGVGAVVAEFVGVGRGAQAEGIKQ